MQNSDQKPLVGLTQPSPEVSHMKENHNSSQMFLSQANVELTTKESLGISEGESIRTSGDVYDVIIYTLDHCIQYCNKVLQFTL